MNSARGAREFTEFYRRDMGSTSRRILIPAAILVFLGAPCVCFGAAVNGTFEAHLLVGVGGGIVLVGGLLLGFLGMARLVGEDSYLAIARDGVVFKSKSDETFHFWSEIVHVKSEPGGIVLELDDDAAEFTSPATSAESRRPTSPRASTTGDANPDGSSRRQRRHDLS